jgi:hypothetical protein
MFHPTQSDVTTPPDKGWRDVWPAPPMFKNAGIRRLRTPLLAPDANAYASWCTSLVA